MLKGKMFENIYLEKSQIYSEEKQCGLEVDINLKGRIIQ